MVVVVRPAIHRVGPIYRNRSVSRIWHGPELPRDDARHDCESSRWGGGWRCAIGAY